MNRHLVINLEDLTVTIRRGRNLEECLEKDNHGTKYKPRIKWLFWFINQYVTISKGNIAWITVVPNAGGPEHGRYPVPPQVT